jgi:ubiquinone biosynthesis monooxygenase Coq7
MGSRRNHAGRPDRADRAQRRPICTEAVEHTVHRHLTDQLIWLGAKDPELSRTIEAIQSEELGHLQHAQSGQDPKTGLGDGLYALISAATELLIWFSTYGASARMARRLRS